MQQDLLFIAHHYLWLIPLGFFAGAYGTVIGAGGGFVLAPVLLLVYPDEAPETITSISLAVVFFNALSGSVAYARAGRIDYKAGVVFSLSAVPGAILGALATASVGRERFDLLFGLLMTLIAGLLAIRPRQRAAASVAQNQLPNIPRLDFSKLLLGAGISCGLGFLSSFLGIGAGFIYVPAFVYLLGFPVHIATATSLFTLTIMAFTGSATHILAGLFHHGARRALALIIGAILGAQLGAWLSRMIHEDWIIRGLAVALGLAGIRLIVAGWP
ncbi:MAG: sulfite exporter TauE/SafE family protein [Acidobacteria bacterium]|nr:sulfite exporter TauE/SafE family protein [Acidobacteriota bacterium]